MSAVLRAPSSKSLTNRSLIVAALAEGTSRLERPLVSDDTHAMAGAVGALGAVVTVEEQALVIHGTGGDLATPAGPVDARLSGTTMRFVTAVAALASDSVTVTGAGPLLGRPIGPLTQALRGIGARAADVGGFPPVTVGGGLQGGEVCVDVTASSQFLSAVLLAAPYARLDVVATTVGESAGAYIAMTADLMRRWGAEVTEESPGRWRVTAGQTYQPRTEAVEYDASAAAHLYALAAATGGSVTVVDVASPTLQPDAAIVDVLAAMGCRVSQEEGAVSVTGPPHLSPVTVDLGSSPDQVTTVAALAALAHGTTSITGVAVARGHETDRLWALAHELRKLQIHVTEHDDGLTIVGGSPRGPARLATHHDHRLGMAFAAVACAVPGVTIEEPGCVAKTYPAFWDDAASAGVLLRRAR